MKSLKSKRKANARDRGKNPPRLDSLGLSSEKSPRHVEAKLDSLKKEKLFLSLLSKTSMKWIGASVFACSLISLNFLKCEKPVFNVTAVSGDGNVVVSGDDNFVSRGVRQRGTKKMDKKVSLKECYEKKRPDGWPAFDALSVDQLAVVKKFCADYMGPQVERLRIILDLTFDRSSGGLQR